MLGGVVGAVLAREIERPDLRVETMVRFGSPADEIVNAVEAAGFDMLVLGSHGHNVRNRFLLGSVSAGVLREITCPLCKGARLRKEAWFVKVGGLSIVELTRLSVAKAHAFFAACSVPWLSS